MSIKTLTVAYDDYAYPWAESALLSEDNLQGTLYQAFSWFVGVHTDG